MIWHELKSLRFHKRNIAVLAIQTCMAKRVRSSKNQQVQPYEKHQLLQIWTNPKLTSFSKKQGLWWYQFPMYKNVQASRIYLPFMILSGDIEAVCLGSCTSISKDWAIRKIWGLLKFTRQHGWPFITLKIVKKYFHAATEWLKSQACTNNLHYMELSPSPHYF